jgi:hypothetical protein
MVEYHYIYPFNELVNNGEDAREATRKSRKIPENTESPFIEWSGDQNHLECLSKRVDFPSIILAPLANAYNVLRIHKSGNRTLVEAHYQQGLRSCVETI